MGLFRQDPGGKAPTSMFVGVNKTTQRKPHMKIRRTTHCVTQAPRLQTHDYGSVKIQVPLFHAVESKSADS